MFFGTISSFSGSGIRCRRHLFPAIQNIKPETELATYGDGEEAKILSIHKNHVHGPVWKHFSDLHCSNSTSAVCSVEHFGIWVSGRIGGFWTIYSALQVSLCVAATFQFSWEISGVDNDTQHSHSPPVCDAVQTRGWKRIRSATATARFASCCPTMWQSSISTTFAGVSDSQPASSARIKTPSSCKKSTSRKKDKTLHHYHHIILITGTSSTSQAGQKTAIPSSQSSNPKIENL